MFLEKTITCVIGLFLTVVAAGASANDMRTLQNRLIKPDGKVMVVSHRGCWKYEAENSLAGIDRCASLGIDMVEIDARATRDGVLVLMHDATVDRTTDGHGMVNALTGAEIHALHQRKFGGGHTELTSWDVPTLREALERARGKILVNVDVKDPHIYERVIRLVTSMGLTHQVLVKENLSSTDPSLRWKIAQIPFSIVLNVPPKSYAAEKMIQHYARLSPVCFELILSMGSSLKGVAKRAKAQHAHIWVNTLAKDVESGRQMDMSMGHDDSEAVQNPVGAWGWLVGNGVDILQTDEPAAALAYLRLRKLHD